MKKYLYISFCLAYILILAALAACGNKAAPIVLPQTDSIKSVDVTVGENTVNYADETWISEIISNISSSEPTRKESVQDVPQVENYIKIDIQLTAKVSTLFAYEDGGKYYIEQPYQGIYEINKQLYEQLQETK